TPDAPLSHLARFRPCRICPRSPCRLRLWPLARLSARPALRNARRFGRLRDGHGESCLYLVDTGCARRNRPCRRWPPSSQTRMIDARLPEFAFASAIFGAGADGAALAQLASAPEGPPLGKPAFLWFSRPASLPIRPA